MSTEDRLPFSFGRLRSLVFVSPPAKRGKAHKEMKLLSEPEIRPNLPLRQTEFPRADLLVPLLLPPLRKRPRRRTPFRRNPPAAKINNSLELQGAVHGSMLRKNPLPGVQPNAYAFLVRKRSKNPHHVICISRQQNFFSRGKEAFQPIPVV